MEKDKTVIINGRAYDAATGMPVAKKPAARKKVERVSPSPATESVHKNVQRSQTLNREIAKKKTALRPKTGRTMDIARSPQVTRFKPEPAKPAPAPKKAATPAKPDRKPTPHPMAARALTRTATPKQKVAAPAVPATKSLKQIKDEEIEKALATEIPKQKVKKTSFWHKHIRKIIVAASVIVILFVGGYFTLINLPSLSVWVASSQAGIKATYPSYLPDGYSLKQPVSFSDGEVVLNFVSNSGGGGYVIKETRSSWDSTAVLENIVKATAGDDYIVTNDSGLTIYSFNGDAAWVNRGILYTIDSAAPLSNDQIRNIATSL